jgi:exopolyphosphatase/guanosine-5'-triphosphate,3'-diphosphate pyrophosphatase
VARRQQTPRSGLLEEMQRRQNLVELEMRLRTFHPADIASILESIPPDDRILAWGSLEPALASAALVEVSEQVREALIESTSAERLFAIPSELDADDLRYLSGKSRVSGRGLRIAGCGLRLRIALLCRYINALPHGNIPTSPPVNPSMPDSSTPATELIGVLDMGASAIRLVVAEIDTRRNVRIIEEASRGVLLGRDTFSGGVIRSQTVDAAIEALDGFREIMDGYADMFLDRIQGRTGIRFEIINEAEESRLVYMAVRHALRRHAALKSARTLLVEVGGGSTSLTLLRRGQPIRSGVYALGAVRLRQQLDLRRHTQELQVALLKRYIANVVEEIRLEIPLDRISHVIAIGGDVRFVASQLTGTQADADVRELGRDQFLAFCDEVERMDEDGVVDRFRLPAVEAETLLPALLIYRTLLSETAGARITISSASLRAGLVLDVAEPKNRVTAEDFEHQVLASAEALGYRYRFDRDHGHQVAMLATRLFEELREEHGLGDRERLLLQVSALLHDVGIYVSLRAHHKHSQYILAASQIFGLSNEETAIVSNIARYHRRGLPQDTHVPFIALDRTDRLIVTKLGAILRLVNALDAEHAQKVRDAKLVRRGSNWILELEGDGDLTMEQLAAAGRSDMFAEVYGRQLVIRRAGVVS